MTAEVKTLLALRPLALSSVGQIIGGEQVGFVEDVQAGAILDAEIGRELS